jgi:cobyrinic acid a,c-diamide synthase
MSENEISALFHQQQSDIAIIEGNKGLYDGMSTTGARLTTVLPEDL